MLDILERSNVCVADQSLQALFKNLQGNILKGHGREHAFHLFFEVDKSRLGVVKETIAQLSLIVTSAREQSIRGFMHREAKEHNVTAEETIHLNFFLSALGYQALDIKKDLHPKDASFNKGAKNDNIINKLNDPAENTWEETYQKPIHGMILIASNEQQKLTTYKDKLVGELGEAGIKVIGEQFGKKLVHNFGANNVPRMREIEHFGYADGLSQPLFFARDVTNNKRANGVTQWDPSAKLKLALVKDDATQEEDSYGSFCVFRKLKQDVTGFNREVHQLATTLNVSDDLAGAYAVGRFKDGTPTALFNQPGQDPINDFTYSVVDKDATRCPLHAHIRKTNPRGESTAHGATLEEEKQRRIVRRGIPFGDPNEADADKGLIFVCFQSSIDKQFEFMQQMWANNEGFVKPETGLDPIVGHTPDGETPIKQKWPTVWGQAGTQPFSLSQFVTLQGAEYFFAPSISFLREIEKIPTQSNAVVAGGPTLTPTSLGTE